jgi:DNA (cytosine-5)-methyltransferase 1
MNVQLPMFGPMTSEGTDSATSSPESADGASRSGSPGGLTTDAAGQGVARVSRSRAPEAQKGGADDRHLWPYWARLISECRPDVVFGEQVESAIAHGWLDLVCDDLEREAYAVGAVDLPAASVGAPHIRQRLWFVAHHDEGRRTFVGSSRLHVDGPSRDDVARRGPSGELADATRRDQRRHTGDARGATGARGGEARPSNGDSAGSAGRLGDGECEGLEERERELQPETLRSSSRQAVERGGDTVWTGTEWIPCRDGKSRPVEPGTFPLAHGLPVRVGRLRGYGNAIVPQVAAEVIRAYMDVSAPWIDFSRAAEIAKFCEARR